MDSEKNGELIFIESYELIILFGTVQIVFVFLQDVFKSEFGFHKNFIPLYTQNGSHQLNNIVFQQYSYLSMGTCQRPEGKMVNILPRLNK